MTKMLNLEDEISFLGVRSDIAKILAGSDLMIMPSHYEGFPVVLVEAQAVGIPSIVSKQVSPEVDLGVEKVFNSIVNIESWVDKIINIKKPRKNENDLRIKILSSKGYDIKQSIRILGKNIQLIYMFNFIPLEYYTSLFYNALYLFCFFFH